MKWSVIIPTYNKLPRLKMVIASIEIQTFDRKLFEVILIDDGSTDGTREFVECLDTDLNLNYITTVHIGRAAARNLGIRNAKNDFIVFADDDTILSPNFLEAHNDSQKTLLKINHGKIINISKYRYLSNPSTGEVYSNLGLSELAIKKFSQMRFNESDIKNAFCNMVGKYNKVSEFEEIIEKICTCEKSKSGWIAFTGGNISMPKIWIEEVGDFDEKFGKNWGCEDLELGYRMFKYGKRFFYDAKAINYHIDHYRSTSALEHSINTEYFIKKHNCIEVAYIQSYIEKKINKYDLMDLLCTLD